jgi:thiamine kinase-like enzyme
LAFRENFTLLNLETKWIEEDGPEVPDNREVSDRIGYASEKCSFLSGGLANHNYDLGDGRILRVYKRSPKDSTIELESNLNDNHWNYFTTAKTLGRGKDFLIQQKLQFSELEDSSEHGSITGSVLGEIHSAKAPIDNGHNDFISSLFETSSLSDLICEKFSWAVTSKDSLLEPYKEWITSSLTQVVQESSEKINLAAADRVLLHGDCKPSNIKKDKLSSGAVVFDWEFSFVGPRLVDVGHFLRWGVNDHFMVKFLSQYKEVAGVDLTGKLQAAKLIDLVNLSFQLAKSIESSARENDILNYIESLIPPVASANKPLQRARKYPLVFE